MIPYFPDTKARAIVLSRPAFRSVTILLQIRHLTESKQG